MPQVPKKDSQQRAQDKESKRARGALSCAECRRLKLKCDKTVPCSSCKRRGCSAICPNGSLITGQGTRFVLADTEALHQKIAVMSDRIRQLEDALAIHHSALNGPEGEPHPLLNRDLLKIKSSIELHAASATGSGERVEKEEQGEEEAEPEQFIDAFGTLAIRDDGAATFYGRSAGSESLLIGEAASSSSSAYPVTPPSEPSPPIRHLSARSSYADFHPSPGSDSYTYPVQYGRNINDGPLPHSIASMAVSFPLAPAASSSSLASPSSYSPVSHTRTTPSRDLITLQGLVAQFLPPYQEAIRLTQLYLEQAPWFFGAVTRAQIDSEILPLWYPEAAEMTSSAAIPLAGGLSPGVAGSIDSVNIGPRTGTSHDIALLFIVFCFGALTDINLPSPPENIPAENYYQLAKAALTLDPAASGSPDTKASKNGILERPPSVATVQTLSLMAIYEGICSRENSIEATWALMGLACKLAQSIGLHRDCARWKLTPAEVQKRRALFWELFITDCWQSLATGRLATFSLPFVDCELPADPDSTIAADGTTQPSFPFWKARFGAECVSAVVQGTLTSRAPKYSIILDLDRKVRDMDLPAYARGEPPQGLGLAQTMSHFMPQNYRELTLLYIHRCFFAHAISSNPLDPIKSQYAPSFLAGYRSACTILASVKLQFSMFPAQIARFWVLWTHAFSASVMLASVVTHSSRSKIAPAALMELRTACELFESASVYGGRAGKFLPILRRLQTKGYMAFHDANSGLPPSVPNDIFKPSQATDAKDELSIFSGKTHTISTRVNPSPSGTAASSPSTQSPSRSKNGRALSDSPQMITDHPSFANVHPSLVSELNSFQGHIKAQIETAYKNGKDLFAGVPMVVDPVPHARGLGVRPKPSIPHIQMQPPSQNQPQHYPPSYSPSAQQPQYAPQQHYAQRQQQDVAYQQTRYQEEQERERQLHVERERKREDAERLEREEYERQEQARKLQLQQQQEIQRQQQLQHEQEMQRQQLEMQRRQELEVHEQQHQREEQYHRELELAQQQQIGQYSTHPSPHQGAHQQSLHASPEATMSSSAYSSPPHEPSQHSGRSDVDRTYQPPLRHSMSHRQLAAASQSHPQQIASHPPVPQHPQTHYQPSNVSMNQQLTHMSDPAQPPHSMYPVSTEYAHLPVSANMHYDSSSSVASYTPRASSYPQRSPPSSVPHVPESYRYWPAASTSFAMPDQQSTATYNAGSHQMDSHHHYHHHYTPESALRGIAADDRGLQETWQSFMNKVGTPRQFMDD